MILDDDEIGTLLIGSAIQIHRVLGPGLLESVYETCLHHELIKAGLEARRQVFLPIEYDGLQFDNAFRTDILVEDKLIVEIKVVERIQPVHLSQLMTYLKTFAPAGRLHLKLQCHPTAARRNQTPRKWLTPSPMILPRELRVLRVLRVSRLKD